MLFTELVTDQLPFTRSGVQMLSLYTNVSARLRLREEKGATAVEYGIMVALIAVVIIAAVALLGGYLNEAFQGINCQINTPDTPKWDAAAEACAA